jgi:hypothetical protein
MHSLKFVQEIVGVRGLLVGQLPFITYCLTQGSVVGRGGAGQFENLSESRPRMAG